MYHHTQLVSHANWVGAALEYWSLVGLKLPICSQGLRGFLHPVRTVARSNSVCARKDVGVTWGKRCMPAIGGVGPPLTSACDNVPNPAAAVCCAAFAPFLVTAFLVTAVCCAAFGPFLAAEPWRLAQITASNQCATPVEAVFLPLAGP